MPNSEQNIERIVEARLAKAKREIIRVVRQQQKERHAARPKAANPQKQKSVRLLVLDALAAGAKSRDAVYQWVFRRLDATTDTSLQQKIANNININLHVLAHARMVRKAKERGGLFSLTAKGERIACA